MGLSPKFLSVWAVAALGFTTIADAGALAKKGELILSNPFEGTLEKKELVEIGNGWQRRVSFGEWTLQPDGSLMALNVPEDGHGPVLTYIAPIRDMVIECEFKIPSGPQANRHFRIFLDHQDYRGHTIQSTANVSSGFRPVGLTLQHISKSADDSKKTIQDIEFGPADIELMPDTWYKMRLDVVGDKAWTSVNGVTLFGRNKVLDVEKSKIGLNPGIAGGSIRNFNAWAVKGENDDAGVEEALKAINDRFQNVEVQIVSWPEERRKDFGNLKRLAFMAYPENRPSGKMPLLISLHGAGGKEMSLHDQLVRSARVKGLALAELAGKDVILLEPNSADSWDPDTLDRMLDYVLGTYGEIDRSRVYVMGHSMGGTGTWNWILKSGERFAAAAPCGFSAGANPEGVEKLVDLPIWGMVGGDDGKNTAAVQAMVENLRAVGNRNVRHTAFPGAKHSQGNAAVFSSMDLVEWILSH
jgi:predicted esterase